MLKLKIMRISIKKIMVMVLGIIIMSSLQSCGLLYSYPCGNGSYQTQYPQYPEYSQYPQGDVIFQFGNITEMGTKKVGSPVYMWIWTNMSIYKRGLMVYVECNGQTLRVYDLRVRGANYDDNFNVEGVTGAALQVSIKVRGGNFAYFTVTDGNSKEHYILM